MVNGVGVAACYLPVISDDFSKCQYSQQEKIQCNPSVYTETSASCNQLPPHHTKTTTNHLQDSLSARHYIN